MKDLLFSLVSAQRGHFRLESGYHSALWLDLDGLFADHAAVRPFIANLAPRLAAHRPEVVCGPLVGGAFLAQHLAVEMGVSFAFSTRADQPAAKLFGTEYNISSTVRRLVERKRVAIVDDVISAGSAVRGTREALIAARAEVVAIGAIAVLGPVARSYFSDSRVPLEAVVETPYDLWRPDQCPLCAAGVPCVSMTD